MHGLPLGKLVLVEYDADWPVLFRQEVETFFVKLKQFVVDVQHIGSTSVPGLMAKPVIDIGVTVESDSMVGNVVKVLEGFKYEFRGRHEHPGHYYLIKSSNGLRLFHMHLWVVPNEGWNAQLQFRDKLRSSIDALEHYAKLKLDWAEKSNWNKLKYSQSKDDFIQEVLNG